MSVRRARRVFRSPSGEKTATRLGCPLGTDEGGADLVFIRFPHSHGVSIMLLPGKPQHTFFKKRASFHITESVPENMGLALLKTYLALTGPKSGSVRVDDHAGTARLR